MGLFRSKLLDNKHRQWVKIRTLASPEIMPLNAVYTDLAKVKCTTRRPSTSSTKRQACCCPQTARLWTRPHYRTNEIEWMPHASSQPDLLVGYRNLIDVSAVALPETINDDYFKHAKAEKVKKAEGDIFTSKKEEYKPSEQRKADQDNVDKQMLEAIKKHP